MKASYPSIYVLGGHRLSATYMKHLCQAKREGLIDFNTLSFIDPADNPFVVHEIKTGITHIKRTYTEGLANIFITSEPAEINNMWLIPDHTAPHVLFKLFLDWLFVMQHRVEILPFSQNLDLPFQKTLESGICAISYATWTCPLECEEPDTCPGINNSRSWDFGNFLRGQDYKGVDSVHFFGCEQIAYGVCGIPLSVIKNEFDRLFKDLKEGHIFLVGTHSKCHGILGMGRITAASFESLNQSL